MKIKTFSNFLRQRFPFPVRKLAVHSFLGCPHRDNKIGRGGCFYCNNSSFSKIAGKREIDIQQQISSALTASRQKGYRGKFIVYYQSYTNTFAELSVLEKMFLPVYRFKDDVVGIAVSTRPDCLEDKVLALLDDLGKNFMVWVEIGLQSAHNRTLQLINRGHNYECFLDAVSRAQKYKNLLLCAHIILGLPGETRNDMLFTITEIVRLRLDGIKIHHLQIIKDTVFQKWYDQGKIKVMDWKDYMNLLLFLLPYLGEDIVVHRLVSDAPDEMLIAPKWDISKQEFLNRLYEELKFIDKIVVGY